jgi:hypothetical protein
MNVDESAKFSVPENLPVDMESRVKVFVSNLHEFGEHLRSLGHGDIVDTYIDMGINMMCLSTGVGILDGEHEIGVNKSVKRGKEEIDKYVTYFHGFAPFIEVLNQAIDDYIK